MRTLSDKITLNLDGDVEVLVKAFIAPIEYTQYNFHVDWDELANLRVVEPEKQYAASIFQAFLPTKPVSLGECWEIEREGALMLLRQLNPHPQLELDVDSGDSYGLWACLRAYNGEFAEILFRIHAEFVLKKGWFAPSQFAGQMVIDRVEKKVVFFKMSVPEATLNFDTRWTRENGNTYADIGYIPKIGLCTDTQPYDVKFVASIIQKEVERTLALRFYKSQQINWISFEDALEMASAQQKLIHVISINGPLTDEAC